MILAINKGNYPSMLHKLERQLVRAKTTLKICYCTQRQSKDNVT